MKILITGASGHFGSLVIESLLSTVPAGQIVASMRDTTKGAVLTERGVEVRHGDFDDPASLDTAFAGIDRLLIVSTAADDETRIRQHTAAIDAATRAGIGFIAYTSIAKADTSKISLADVHRATEGAILATGIPYSFLRNNWYLENLIADIRGVLAGAPLATSAEDGRVGWVTRADLAEAAAIVMAGTGHENSIYELSGPPITYDQLAEVLGDVLDRNVDVLHVDDQAFGEILAGVGLPDFVVALYVGIQGAIREGDLDVAHSHLPALLGRPLTSLKEGLARIVSEIEHGGAHR